MASQGFEACLLSVWEALSEPKQGSDLCSEYSFLNLKSEEQFCQYLESLPYSFLKSLIYATQEREFPQNSASFFFNFEVEYLFKIKAEYE